MTRLFVLVEGPADVPTVREILVRRFGLHEGSDFKVFPHQGKGRLPSDLLSPPERQLRGLLHQLPAKLRGFSHLGHEACVVVLVDADDEPCDSLLRSLNDMLHRLPRRPARVLFRIAIEETESWFIADPQAVSKAYPRTKLERLRRIPPDAVVGAAERLAEALGIPARSVTGSHKAQWGEHISPHLDLKQPRSPSLRKFVDGVARQLETLA